MDTIAGHAARHPDRAAVIEGERQHVLGRAGGPEQPAGQAAAGLGLAPGDHVAVYAGNSIENLLVGAALRAFGGMRLPINQRLVADEVAYILDDSDAVAVFVGD